MRSLNEFIGNEIRVRRVLRGLSAEGLARRCSVEYRVIECWEDGTLAVTAAELFVVASALDTDPARFFPQIGGPLAA